MRFAVVLLAMSSAALAKPPEIVPPKLLEFVVAPLPSGTPLVDAMVGLGLTIDATGRVTDVVVNKSAGEPWDGAAKVAARAFRFAPATQDGQPIAVTVPFAYRFSAPARRGIFLGDRAARRPPSPTPGYTLSGTVLEKGTRSPLAGIAVEVRDAATGKASDTTTDALGAFAFEGLPPGVLTLVIVTGEHRPFSKQVVAGKVLDTVYLDPIGVAQYRTVVKDKPKPAAADEIHLSEEELTRMPGTFGDPTRVVAALPGVARSPFGLGYYIVRGASFENTGFFIDGHPALYLYHLLGGPGVVHPELIGDLTFWPGGYPASYGRYAAGAIALETKSPPADRWHLDVDMDFFKTSLLGSVPFEKERVEVTASVRRSYYELLIPLFTDDDVTLSFTDYQLRVTWQASQRLRAKLLALGAEDRAGTSGEDAPGGGSSSDQGLATGFHRVLGVLEADLAPKVLYTNSLVWEYDYTSAKRAAEGDDSITVGVGGWFAQLRSFVEWKPLTSLTFEGGVDALFTDLGADLRIPSVPPIGDPRPPRFDPIIVHSEIDETFTSVAPYVMADWEVVPSLRLLPGVRMTVDYYTGGAHVTADPKLAARWRFLPGWTIKAMGALAHQAPPLFQTAEPFGDPTLPPVRAVQSSLGLEWEHESGWEVSAEGFYNLMDFLARPAGQLSTDEDSVNRRYWAADMRGRAYGLELLIRKRIGGRMYGWLSYTLSRSERLRPPADWARYEADQTHILNLAWTVRLGADWSVGARFTLTSGNPFFPVESARYDADRDRYEPLFSSTSERLPAYHRLDLRIDKRWRFDTWFLEAYLDVQNVYNAGNPESQRYSYDYKIRVDGVGLPILPTLGVRAAF